jgi:hypothetical protein
MRSRRTTISLFPHMPRSMKIVDKMGILVEHWHLSLMNLYQTLQSTFKNTGFVAPKMNTVDFSEFVSRYTPYVNKVLPGNLADDNGSFAFDIDNNFPRWFIITYNPDGTFLSATWKEVQLV